MNGRLFQVGGVAATAFAAGGLAQQTSAAPVVVVNPGFEDIRDSGGNLITLFSGDYTSGMDSTVLNRFRQNQPVTVAGWTSDSGPNDFFDGVEDQSPALAGTQAFLNPGGVFRQTLTGTVQAGTYTLSADIGDSNARPFAAPTMELFNAATGVAYTPITSLNPTPPDGELRAVGADLRLQCPRRQQPGHPFRQQR